MKRSGGFLAELKRRNVIRMAVMYLVCAWVLVQVAETVLPIFLTPGWVLQALVVLVAVIAPAADRPLGSEQGTLLIADDFDEPLSPDLLDAFER